MITSVFALPSHLAWKSEALKPSRVARYKRSHFCSIEISNNSPNSWRLHSLIIFESILAYLIYNYNNGKILNELINIISRDLELIRDWLHNNRLVLNLAKTHAMLIGANKSDESPQIYFGNEIIKFISEIIYNKLSFSSQVSNLCNKVNKKTYILN